MQTGLEIGAQNVAHHGSGNLLRGESGLQDDVGTRDPALLIRDPPRRAAHAFQAEPPALQQTAAYRVEFSGLEFGHERHEARNVEPGHVVEQALQIDSAEPNPRSTSAAGAVGPDGAGGRVRPVAAPARTTGLRPRRRPLRKRSWVTAGAPLVAKRAMISGSRNCSCWLQALERVATSNTPS